VTPDVPSVLVLTGSLGTIKGNAIKRAALAKGAPIPISCGLDSDAAATLTLKSAVAKKLKIPVKKKQTDVTIGSAKGKCTAAAGGTLKLTLARSLAAKVRKPKKGFAANLTVVFTRAGSTPVKVPRALKLT
jgi:hypothetical protein